jgi:serine/threonine-protein kinase HipA
MSNHLSVLEVKVKLDFGDEIVPVGRLASRNNRIYFEYDAEFIKSGLEISPIRLPLETGVKSFDPFLFEGLAGVFNDSLPDGWGRLLFDRMLRANNLLVGEVTPLDRLTHVGHNGMGALVYEPDYSDDQVIEAINLDTLATHAEEVLEGEAESVLQELIALNGSSAGARPKAVIGVDAARDNIVHGLYNPKNGYENWIVKFSNIEDGQDAGAIEYVYALMAKEAGLEMMDVHLFPSQRGAGYFATKRFDRDGEKRFHVHSACGLLHSDFRTPSLDYEDLMALTGILTKDVREVEKMFRIAVFNVLAHNRDDHSKNFSYIMDRQGEWRFAPAYDLTFSSGPQGQQSTMVMGEGKAPNIDHLIKLGQAANLEDKHINEIIDQTKYALNKWKSLAQEYGVSKSNIELVASRLVV